MFGSCFSELLLRTVFENTKNVKMMFSKNCFCYLNLVFSVFSMFFITKRYENQTCSLCFPFSFCFSKQKIVIKNKNQTGQQFLDKKGIRVLGRRVKNRKNRFSSIHRKIFVHK